jgi:tetratricopeptide (TPR) repeat protein
MRDLLMFDVSALEKKWFRYRLKKAMPLLATAVILLISAGAASYLFILKPGFINGIVNSNPVIVDKRQPEVDKNITTAILPVTQIPKKDEQNILKPSFSFMYNIEDQIINYNNAKVIESISAAESKEETAKTVKSGHPVEPAAKTEVKSRESSKTSKTEQQVVTQQKKQPVEKKIVKASEPVKTVVVVEKIAKDVPKEPLFQITHDQISDDELNSVIKRFEKLKNPALSLFIAKKYYVKGNYQEAYNYALETNRLNPEIEESVLIFSKSLVKLGKREDAISTLKAYLGKSNSTEATILLDKIEKGKFK